MNDKVIAPKKSVTVSGNWPVGRLWLAVRYGEGMDKRP